MDDDGSGVAFPCWQPCLRKILGLVYDSEPPKFCRCAVQQEKMKGYRQALLVEGGILTGANVSISLVPKKHCLNHCSKMLVPVVSCWIELSINQTQPWDSPASFLFNDVFSIQSCMKNPEFFNEKKRNDSVLRSLPEPRKSLAIQKTQDPLKRVKGNCSWGLKKPDKKKWCAK